jgi:hypothetical protein
MADDLGSMSKRARKKARAMSKKSGKLTRRQRKKLTD